MSHGECRSGLGRVDRCFCFWLMVAPNFETTLFVSSTLVLLPLSRKRPTLILGQHDRELASRQRLPHAGRQNEPLAHRVHHRQGGPINTTMVPRTSTYRLELNATVLRGGMLISPYDGDRKPYAPLCFQAISPYDGPENHMYPYVFKPY